MGWLWIIPAIAAVALILPFYLYVVSKYIQVGRMAGARWFTQHCSRERKE